MSRFGNTIKQAFRQIGRNRAMTLASVFAISAMLLILGLFLVIIININMMAESVKQDYNNVQVFLLDETTEEQCIELQNDIRNWDAVDTVEYRTKDQAMEVLKKRWGENAYLLDSIVENPLPNSIIITMTDLTKADEIADKAATLEGVEDVTYYKDTVDKLLRATRMMQIAALIIMAFLIIVSVVVVSNTIKLTVFNRSEEIEIMKYVGATNWFIRGPFMLEGIIIGAFSALLSAGIVTFVYTRVLDVIGTSVTSVLSMPLVPVSFLGLNLMWIFLALGVSIGAWGSIVSMRRFLDT